MSKPAPTTSETYLTIASRLAAFNPPVLLKDHIDFSKEVTAGRNTLDGITFTAKNPWNFRMALRNAKDGGETVFAEGREDSKHWALKLSFLATHGIGFRQIWRPKLSTRPLLPAERPNRFAPAWDRRFSANFGDSPDLPDLSSLHCAVADDICNCHIDQMGFVMTGPGGDFVVDPDFLRHILVELLWKTKLQGKIPLWALDRFNFVVPSSANDYSRAGLSFDLLQSKTYKLTLTGSCGILGGFDCSGTITFGGTHDLGSGR